MGFGVSKLRVNSPMAPWYPGKSSILYAKADRRARTVASRDCCCSVVSRALFPYIHPSLLSLR